MSRRCYDQSVPLRYACLYINNVREREKCYELSRGRCDSTMAIQLRKVLETCAVSLHLPKLYSYIYSFFNEMVPALSLEALFSFCASFFCLLDLGGDFCAFLCSLFAILYCTSYSRGADHWELHTVIVSDYSIGGVALAPIRYDDTAQAVGSLHRLPGRA